MYTNAQIKPLLALVAAISASADSGGCSDDLTVASASAIEAAQEVATLLEGREVSLVIGQHDYRHDSGFYAFAVVHGATFDQEGFQEFLGDTFQPEREEFAYVRPFADKDFNLIEAESSTSIVDDESDRLETLIDAATQHGEDSDPDHEVGDLQDYLRAMWSILTPEQRAAFPGLPDVRSTYEAATGGL